jgi:hypothetical protein
MRKRVLTKTIPVKPELVSQPMPFSHHFCHLLTLPCHTSSNNPGNKSLFTRQHSRKCRKWSFIYSPASNQFSAARPPDCRCSNWTKALSSVARQYQIFAILPRPGKISELHLTSPLHKSLNNIKTHPMSLSPPTIIQDWQNKYLRSIIHSGPLSILYHRDAHFSRPPMSISDKKKVIYSPTTSPSHQRYFSHLPNINATLETRDLQRSNYVRPKGRHHYRLTKPSNLPMPVQLLPLPMPLKPH